VKVVPVRASWDVPAAWRDGPFGDLLAHQNLGAPLRRRERAALLLACCIDHRIALRLPEGFAYEVRVGGANLAAVPFNLSYAVGLKGIRHVAIVAHPGCGAAGLLSRREEMVRGLVAAGWDAAEAARHFDAHAPLWDVADPVLFAARQAQRLPVDYPEVAAAAFLYDLGDGTLSIVT
jgi:carbonic anhydrase